MRKGRQGITCALGAYGLWGVLPAYWKALHGVPAPEILTHRILWSCVFLAGLLVAWGEWANLRDALHRPRTILIYALAAGLVAGNWLTYIWTVNADRIVETSLGYFINPLVSVMLGVVFLKEHLRRLQWVAVGVAAVGVGYLTWQYGALPWVALLLASSFGLYGLVKKLAPLGALAGLTLETALLFLPALGYVAMLQGQGEGHFVHGNLRTTGLLVFTGVVTALPLLLFAQAARSVSLSTVGLLQFLAPSLQLMVGVFGYHEPFRRTQVIGFAMIWLALGLFWGEGFLRRRLASAGLC